MLRTLVSQVQEYTENPDPLAHAAGTIAIVVAGNQPFYPLYLHAIVGAAAWPAWLTLLSTPFFLMVPAIARRNSLLGRAILPIAGVANTVLCVKIFGIFTTGRARRSRGALFSLLGRIVPPNIPQGREPA